MKNTECMIRLTTSGGAVQTWHRDDRGSIETSSRGIERLHSALDRLRSAGRAGCAGQGGGR